MNGNESAQAFSIDDVLELNPHCTNLRTTAPYVCGRTRIYASQRDDQVLGAICAMHLSINLFDDSRLTSTDLLVEMTGDQMIEIGELLARAGACVKARMEIKARNFSEAPQADESVPA